MKKETKKKETKKAKGLDQLQKKQVLLLIVLFVVVAAICFGFTYVGVKMYEKEVEEEQLKLSSLEVVVEETSSSSIVMDDPYPMNEAGGLSTEPYKFTLKNTGSYNVNYSLNLIEDTEAIAACTEANNGVACKTVSIDSIRYSIRKDGEDWSTGLLKDDKGVIDMGIVSPASDEVTGSVDYELKLWVDFDTEEDVEGAKFYGKIDVRVQTGD